VIELGGNISATAMALDREYALSSLAAADAHMTRIIAERAPEAHTLLGLNPPREDDLLEYKNSIRLLSGVCKNGVTDLQLILAVSAAPLVDSTLSLLRSERNPALLKTDKVFEARLEFLMWQTAAKYDLTGLTAKEYGVFASGVSNRIAKYPRYSRYCEPTLRLRFMLPSLVDHLIAEVQLSIDSGFKMPGSNLISNSVFQIQEKLAELSKHPNEIVRDNALAIHSIALGRGKIKTADAIVRELLGNNDRRRERQLVRLRGNLRHEALKRASKTSS
jgi:hypothetical protein